jgi:hypothetical protein
MNSGDNQHHVFISYARSDLAYADRVVNSLASEGIDAWIDREGLQPGTPDWEAAIRTAVENTIAVVLLASPRSASSHFVNAEIQLANSFSRPIYPLWIDGSNWIDAVPLVLANTQGIDCRNALWQDGVRQLINILKSHLKDGSPKHFYSESDNSKLSQSIIRDQFEIVVDTQHSIYVNAWAFDTLRELADDIYMHYLRDRFDPFTYGESWVITGLRGRTWRNLPEFGRVVVPWKWLYQEHINRPIVQVDPEWGAVSPISQGFTRGSRWMIVSPAELHCVGIATNKSDLAKLGLSSDNSMVRIKELFGALKHTRDRRISLQDVGSRLSNPYGANAGTLTIEVTSPASLDTSLYKHAFVIDDSAWHNSGTALTIT